MRFGTVAMHAEHERDRYHVGAGTIDVVDHRVHHVAADRKAAREGNPSGFDIVERGGDPRGAIGTLLRRSRGRIGMGAGTRR